MLTLAASRWARKPTTTTAAPTARATIASTAGVTKRSITTSNTAALPLPPPSATTVAVVESVAKQLSPTATPVTTVAPSVSNTPVTLTAALTKSTSVASSSVSHRHQPTVSNSPSRPLFPPPLALLQSSSPFPHTRAYPSAPLISKINVQAHSTSQPEDNSHTPKPPSSPILLVGTTSTTSPSTSAAASCLPAPLRTLSPSAVPFFPASDPAKKIRPAPAKPRITTADLSLLTTWSDVETNSVAAFFGDTDNNSFSSSPEFTSTDRAPIAASPIIVEPAASTPEVSTEAAEAALTTDAAEATLPTESTEARPLTEVAEAEPEAVAVHSPATIAFISAANAANAVSIRVSAPPAPVVKPKEYPKPPQDLKVASPPPSSEQEQEQVQQQTPSPPQSPPPTVAEPELAIPTAEKEYSPTMANPKNKGPAVNPYAAFVAACDPDGTMPDGRVYVGTKSHHLDRPAPPRPTAQSAKHTFSFPQSQGRPQGASAPPQFQSQSRPQAQTQAQAQNRPAQSQGAYRAPPNMPSARRPNAPQNNYRGNQPPQPQSGAPQQMRTLADSRWSGRALATAAALPDGFFSTAKAGVTSPTPAPQARPQSTNPAPSPQQQKRQLASNSDQGHNNTQRAFSSMSISNQEKPKTANSPRNSQAPGPQQNTYQQQQPQQQQQRSQGAQANGRSGPHMTPSYQGPSSRSTREDDFSDDDRSSSSVPSRTARPRMSMTQEEIPGNPRFFQYNVGDGCHMVVAMYMEKDASTALARFPQLARVRNDSSSSVKSVDEVTQIFRSAVIEEKESLKDK